MEGKTYGISNVKIFLISLFFIVLFSACESKIKINNKIVPHTKLLNLNGQVEKIYLNCINYEISENGYKEIDDSNFKPMLFRQGVDQIFNLLFSNFQSTLVRKYNFLNTNAAICINSNYIGLREINEEMRTITRCTDIEISFNKNGFITDFRGYNKRDLIFKHSLEYSDNNQVVKSIITGDASYSKTGWFREGITTYEYYENGLIKRIREERSYLSPSLTTMDFRYEKDKDGFVAFLTSDDDRKTLFNGYKAFVKLNNELLIEKITSDSLETILSFSDNGLVKQMYNKSFRLNFDYQQNKLQYIKNDNQAINIEYNPQDDIIQTIIDNNKSTSIICNYKYDANNNWTEQSITMNNDWVNGTMALFKKLKLSEEQDQLDGLLFLRSNRTMEILEELAYARISAQKQVINRHIQYY